MDRVEEKLLAFEAQLGTVEQRLGTVVDAMQSIIDQGLALQRAELVEHCMNIYDYQMGRIGGFREFLPLGHDAADTPAGLRAVQRVLWAAHLIQALSDDDDEEETPAA